MQPENPPTQPSEAPVPGAAPPPPATPATPLGPQVITPDAAPQAPPVPPAPPADQPQVMPPATPQQPYAGPVIGQPGTMPTVGQVPPTQPAPPMAQPFEPSGGRKKNILIMAGLVIVVIVLIIAGLSLIKHPITRQQVISAQTAAENFNTDVFDATNSINDAGNATSAGAVKADIDKANSKLDEAQKEFATLKKSNVLSDKSTGAAFKSLDTKWGPYLSYLRDSADDTGAIMPVFIDFSNKTDELDKTDPTTNSQLSSYLSQFKQLVDSTSKQVGQIKPALSEDQDLLSAFKADLSSSSSAIAKAQGDLSAGKPSYVVQDDILGVLDAQTKFIDKVNNITDKLDAKEKSLSIDKAYNGFADSLDKLMTKVNK